MTCASATLSAVSRYWDMSAEHLAVAEEICYDGTPPTASAAGPSRTAGPPENSR